MSDEALKKFLENEEAVKALERTLEMLVKLKESGTLDLIATLVEKMEDLMEVGMSDKKLHHALALGDAALSGLEEVDPISLKKNVEKLSECTMKALSDESLTNAKPVGLLGLLSAIRDPDVATGLGLLLAMAKSLGKCIRGQ